MSEWIDFFIYAAQIVLIWLFLPRQSVRYTVPAIVDRDPGWPAAHPAAMRALEQSRWFLRTFYAWTAVCLGVLLAARLDLLPEALAPADVPTWEVLRRAHGVLIVIGLVGYFACFLVWLRWLAVNVPLAAERRAVLKPRAMGDYLSLPWRAVTEIVTAGHIAVWLILPALGFGGDAEFWGRFAFIAVMTVAFALYGYFVPQRRPRSSGTKVGGAPMFGVTGRSRRNASAIPQSMIWSATCASRARSKPSASPRPTEPVVSSAIRNRHTTRSSARRYASPNKRSA